MIRFILPLAFLIQLAACAQGDSATPESFVVSHEPNALVLDVRTPAEYSGGHVDGAININLFASDFREQVAEFDRQRPVYLYCGSGQRSGRAAAILSEMCFERAVNVGGYGELKAAGAEVVEP